MKVSVIIPALNEEANVARAIESVGNRDEMGTEVIVADGGSSDGTALAAGRLGVAVALSAPGRGRQMDTGAATATSEVLLFLHADTVLPGDWLEAVRSALADPAVVAGAFTLAVDSKSPWLRFVEYTVDLRSRFLGVMYGDQAIFVRREVFERVGGYLGLPLMEDVDLMRRLRREGGVVSLKERVLTSARRWRVGGGALNSVKNWFFLALYFAGVSPDRLYRFYYGRRAG